MRLMAVLRGLVHRGGSTVMIEAVALVAIAAAAAGPIYYQAARTSILRDTLASAQTVGRGYESTATGAVPGLLSHLSPVQQNQRNAQLGGLSGRGLFAPPVESIETAITFPLTRSSIQLVWRSGVCRQLRISGSCPAARGQVIVSRRLAASVGWHIGQQIRFAGWKPFTITGTYSLPDQNRDYWFGRGAIYFSATTVVDAMFTPRGTLEHGPPQVQGTAAVDDLLNTSRVTGDDVGQLAAAMGSFSNDLVLQGQQISVGSTIQDTLTRVESSWRSVAVPVTLITLQLLVLCLLLLFLTVTDAIDARGHEVALARLRGRGGWRTLTFALSEPVLLLAVALPIGTLTGWGATAALAPALLRPGTAVVLPPLAWAAAAVATMGGLVAVVLAARRTLRRTVLEEWRRSGRRPTSRGWVGDAVLATGAAAGLLELAVSGQIGSARGGALGLLVPGLLGLTVAVVASRLLPLGCKAAFGRTSRRGGIGAYLALRHVARRPGGVRTTIVLTTAFALAAFSVTAWSVNRNNEMLVAATQVGAPAVLTVSVPAGKDLGAVVARADPGGRMAAAVDQFTSLSPNNAGLTTLAVDPQRFARVATWRRGFTSEGLTALGRRLAPRVPPQVVLSGDALRITIDVHSLTPPGSTLAADVTTGASPVYLGALPGHGTVTLAGQLTGCPCVLQDLDLSPPARLLPSPVSGSITISRLEVHGPAGWAPAYTGGVLSAAARWRAGHQDNPPDRLLATPAGLSWRFKTSPTSDAILQSVNRPFPLPAVVSSALVSPGQGLVSGTGLDGRPLIMRVISAAAVIPGAPQTGVIIDRRYAELAADESFPMAAQQVWLAPGAQAIIEPRLKAAGVHVLSTRVAAALASVFARQGPALASLLFLADAAAAALLAAGAAVLTLYLSARRRRYEYAALCASGIPRGTLRRAVLTELAVVLGFGSIIGAATGLLAALLTLRSIPEFITRPAVPPLSYIPSAGPLALVLGAAAALLIIAAVTASVLLIRGVSLDELRESPT